MIVDHHCQPGPRLVAVRIHNHEIEFGVIGLPDRIRSVGAMPVDELESVAIGGRAVMGQRDETGVELAYDRVDGRVGWHRPPLGIDQCSKPPMNGRSGKTGRAKRKPLDDAHKSRWQATAPCI